MVVMPRTTFLCNLNAKGWSKYVETVDRESWSRSNKQIRCASTWYKYYSTKHDWRKQCASTVMSYVAICCCCCFDTNVDCIDPLDDVEKDEDEDAPLRCTTGQGLRCVSQSGLVGQTGPNILLSSALVAVGNNNTIIALSSSQSQSIIFVFFITVSVCNWSNCIYICKTFFALASIKCSSMKTKMFVCSQENVHIGAISPFWDCWMWRQTNVGRFISISFLAAVSPSLPPVRIRSGVTQY